MGSGGGGSDKKEEQLIKVDGVDRYGNKVQGLMPEGAARAKMADEGGMAVPLVWGILTGALRWSGRPGRPPVRLEELPELLGKVQAAGPKGSAGRRAWLAQNIAE